MLDRFLQYFDRLLFSHQANSIWSVSIWYRALSNSLCGPNFAPKRWCGLHRQNFQALAKTNARLCLCGAHECRHCTCKCQLDFLERHVRAFQCSAYHKKNKQMTERSSAICICIWHFQYAIVAFFLFKMPTHSWFYMFCYKTVIFPSINLYLSFFYQNLFLPRTQSVF